MFGILGRKVGMSHLFTSDGQRYAVTLIEAGPCVVTQIKTRENDGYDAIQLGYMAKTKSVTKPMQGHFNKAKRGAFKYTREFRVDDIDQYELGQTVSVGDFIKGDVLKITGTSKGKGFQGVMKRHGFHGGRKTHGSRSHRIPGSIGNSTTPGRTIKGRRMPGQTGNKRVTEMNIVIMSVESDKNLIYVKGHVPGARDGLVKLQRVIHVEADNAAEQA